MSRGSRQEVLIRSLMEGLCLTLEKCYHDKPRQKAKLLAIHGIMKDLMELWRTRPIPLTRKEADRIRDFLVVFDEKHKDDEAWRTPEILIAMVMALGDHLYQVIQDPKKQNLIGQITLKIQALYDTFDRQGAKLALMERGGQLADAILRQEV